MSASKAVTHHTKQPPVTDSVDLLPTISTDVVQRESVDELVARAVALVREHARIEHQPTILLKNLAVVLVELRTRCTTSDGEMDLLGRSQDYRDKAATVYQRAGIPRDSEDRVQSSVRYHIGNYIRERFDAETLERYGLSLRGPRARKELDRQSQAAVLAAASAMRDLSPPAGSTASSPAPAAKKSRSAAQSATAEAEDVGAQIKMTADHIRYGKAVASIVAQMSTDVIARDLTPGQAAKLDDLLAEAQETIAKLRRHTRKRRSEES